MGQKSLSTKVNSKFLLLYIFSSLCILKTYLKEIIYKIHNEKKSRLNLNSV